MIYDYDAAIIGGGPAGAAAALNLVSSGFNVCLIEKKTFPRETICGEFLSKEVIENLKTLGLFNEFICLKPNTINKFRFINNNGKDVSSCLDFTSYSIKRSTFDYFLLNQAKKRGVTVIQPAEAANITNLKSKFKIECRTVVRTEYVYARKVIAAYGKQNVLDKQLDRNFVNKKSRLNGIKFHINESFFNNFNRNEIQIYAGEKIYCGINAVNGGDVTLCFLENRNKYHGPIKNHLKDLYNKNFKFRNLFKIDISTIINDLNLYGTGNIYFGKRNIIENGIYMLGDAAGVIAPLAGDGIGMAFESAKILAKILFEEKEKNIDDRISKQKFVSEWDNIFRRRMFTAKLIQSCIFKTYSRHIGFNLVKAFPASLDYFVKSTRT